MKIWGDHVHHVFPFSFVDSFLFTLPAATFCFSSFEVSRQLYVAEAEKLRGEEGYAAGMAYANEIGWDEFLKLEDVPPHLRSDPHFNNGFLMTIMLPYSGA